MPDNTAYQDMLNVIRDFQRMQLDRNQAFIEGLPPHVKALIPEDHETLLEGFYAMVYSDAIGYLRNLTEAEKERQEFRTSSSQMVPYITRVDGNTHNNTLSNLRFSWAMMKKDI